MVNRQLKGFGFQVSGFRGSDRPSTKSDQASEQGKESASSVRIQTQTDNRLSITESLPKPKPDTRHLKPETVLLPLPHLASWVDPQPKKICSILPRPITRTNSQIVQ